MIYTLYDSWYTIGDKRIYRFKDTTGNYFDFVSEQIKAMMANNHSFLGVTLTKDNRLIIDTKKSSTVKLAQPSPTTVNMLGYQVFTGSALKTYAAKWTHGRRVRNAVQQILDRLANYQVGKVCVVKGLRRTGKTTAIMHTIEALEQSGIPLDRVGYILVTSDTADTDEVIKHIGENYWEYVFVDEITFLKGLISKLKTVSDVIAVHKKIVLTGTDSYVWPMAAMDVLYGRQMPVDLTYMSFQEYCVVFRERVEKLSKEEAVQHFCRFGGVLDKDEYATLQNAYISLQTSLVANIVNTISRNKNHSTIQQHAGSLYDVTEAKLKHAVICAILQVCETRNGDIFQANGLKIPQLVAEILGLVDDLDSQEALRVEGVKHNVLRSLLQALIQLNVLDTVKNCAVSTARAQPQTNMELVCHVSSLYNAVIGSTDESLRLTGSAFENLILSQCVQFVKTSKQKYIWLGLTDDIDVGYCRYHVSPEYLNESAETDNKPEVDIIVSHSKSNKMHKRVLIEVKLAQKTMREHWRKMFVPSMLETLGRIDRRIVVYNGNTLPINSSGVEYVNACDFLMNIGNWLN